MSIGALSPISTPTCTDVIERIGIRTDLPPRRRHDLSSAVRRFCRLQNRPPHDVRADPMELRHQLKQMSPIITGLSPGGFRNFKSLLGKALITAGVTSVPRRSRTPLTPEWKQLLARIADRHQRYSLSHLARYCSARDRLPADIDNDVLAQYGEDLISKSLLDRPKQAYRNACLAWNMAVDTIAGWPQQRLTVPNRRRIYARSLSAFPESLQSDVENYLRHLTGDDLLGEMAARPASPDTLKGRRKQILAVASALVEAGRDPQAIRSLADLVEPEAAKEPRAPGAGAALQSDRDIRSVLAAVPPAAGQPAGKLGVSRPQWTQGKYGSEHADLTDDPQDYRSPDAHPPVPAPRGIFDPEP